MIMVWRLRLISGIGTSSYGIDVDLELYGFNWISIKDDTVEGKNFSIFIVSEIH